MNESTHKEQALRTTGGFVELSERSYVRLTGADRHSFLHNFCTNEIKQLKPGNACEAFVLNTKGKILGFVHVLAFESELLLTGHGPQADPLIQHLDMYLIREEVELADASQEFSSVFVAGNDAGKKLAGHVDLPKPNCIVESKLGPCQVCVSNVELAGFGFLLTFDKANQNDVVAKLVECGLVKCSLESLDICRVESQTPWFGHDATDANLPQELNRDEKAINFNKGCYLGQETVARIDARGRVNQLLVGLKFDGDLPNVGDAILVDEKPAAKITSVAMSERLGAIGLGFVRRQFVEAGTQIGNATVLDQV